MAAHSAKLVLAQPQRVANRGKGEQRHAVEHENRRERHAYRLVSRADSGAERRNRAAAADGGSARDQRARLTVDAQEAREEQPQSQRERDARRGHEHAGLPHFQNGPQRHPEAQPDHARFEQQLGRPCASGGKRRAQRESQHGARTQRQRGRDARNEGRGCERGEQRAVPRGRLWRDGRRGGGRGGGAAWPHSTHARVPVMALTARSGCNLRKGAQGSMMGKSVTRIPNTTNSADQNRSGINTNVCRSPASTNTRSPVSSSIMTRGCGSGNR